MPKDYKQLYKAALVAMKRQGEVILALRAELAKQKMNELSVMLHECELMPARTAQELREEAVGYADS